MRSTLTSCSVSHSLGYSIKNNWQQDNYYLIYNDFLTVIWVDKQLVYFKQLPLPLSEVILSFENTLVELWEVLKCNQIQMLNRWVDK